VSRRPAEESVRPIPERAHFAYW
jgi:mannitol/fructose-specific phosphotransferase system IIA component (Ntr-type)